MLGALRKLRHISRDCKRPACATARSRPTAFGPRDPHSLLEPAYLDAIESGPAAKERCQKLVTNSALLDEIIRFHRRKIVGRSFMELTTSSSNRTRQAGER